MSKEFEEVIERLDNMNQTIVKMNKQLSEKIDEVDERINKKIDEVDERINNKIDELDERINNKIDEVDERINNKIDELDERINNKIDEVDKQVNNTMNDMKKTLIILEDKMTTEFPSLYEIYSLNYKNQKENEKKLKSVEKTTSKHSIQISHLYETVQSHEKQLKKLTS